MNRNKKAKMKRMTAFLMAVREAKKGDGSVILNHYVEKHGGAEGIFLITQYFVNSYLDEEYYPQFDSDLSFIRKGGVYSYDFHEKWYDHRGKKFIGTLTVNGRTYRLPVGYKDRIKKYNEALSIFQ